jgi:monofunctional biosynthetic peptidoglycan transglycosylase
MSDEEEPKLRRVTFGKVILILITAFLIVKIVMLPFPWTVASLRTENPGLTAMMKERIRQAELTDEAYKIRDVYVPLSRISDSFVHAVIVGEDGTFFEHHGVDWYEVRQSLEKNWDEKKIVRGSSTITMQLAKNLWFSTSRDPLTKLNEIVAAYMLECCLTKDRILELYLNEIEFGRGVFGVEAASRAYFGKPASQLSRDEAAKLVAIIPSPIRHSPNSDSKFVSRRFTMILIRMEARGW